MKTTNETACIGCAVLDDKAAAEIVGTLAPDDFSDPDLREAFIECRRLWNKTGHLDAATVSNLPHANLIAECAGTLPSLSAWKTYMANVKNDAVVSRVAVAALALASGAMEISEVEAKVGELAQMLGGIGSTHIYTMAELAAQFCKEQISHKQEYFQTGYSTLDKYLYLSPSDFFVIAARPSVGKTAFSLNLALNFAIKNYRVAYFSLETQPSKIFNRMAAIQTGTDFGDIKRRKTNFDKEGFPEELDEMCDYSISMIPASGRTVGWMRAQAARLKAQIAIVDYLGLVSAPGKDRYSKVTEISLALHDWAQQTGTLIIALSQLSRAGAVEPTLETLRESGQIEQDADEIILLHRNDDGTCKAIIAKNKDGEVGTVPFQFDGAHQRFTPIYYGND